MTNSEKEYITPCCNKKLSKSGYYRHMSKPCSTKKKGEKDESNFSSPSVDSSDEETSSSPPPSWSEWIPSGDVTESLPTPLKVLATTKTTRSKTMTDADIETMREQSRAMLSLCLTGWDSLATSYAKAITLDKEYLISHSEQEKYLVADAQARYLEARGFYVTDVLGTGTIAAALTAGYVFPPLVKAHRKSKRSFISPTTKGKMANFMRRVPVLRRLIRKKKEVVQNETEPSP
tara:strand:- start:5470 stop:6168 length:699 start_codon:yes stop_codon:yes gene_type:complete